MEIRPLSPDFAVSPQISVDDVAAIAADGYTHVICNRPAFESAPEDSPEAIKAAVEAAGLGWSDNPLAHGQPYCASGTRSSVIWALSQAGQMETDAILGALEKAGYPTAGLRDQIEMLAQR